MPLGAFLTQELERLEGARPRRREDKWLPGVVIELDGPWSGPELALTLAQQEGFGVSCFKQFPDFLEATVTDYRDGSNASVFASEQELVVFPGFAASARFLSDLVAIVSDQIGVAGLSDWSPEPVSADELFVGRVASS
jgi:hypothetical protein